MTDTEIASLAPGYKPQREHAELFRSCVKDWGLYRPEHGINCIEHPGAQNGVVHWLGYRVSGWPGVLDLEYVPGGIMYLLNIEIPKEHRGQYHGEALYLAVVRFAVVVECYQVRQTPSGVTGTGRSRKSYLVDRGWVPDGREVYFTLNSKGSHDGSKSH